MLPSDPRPRDALVAVTQTVDDLAAIWAADDDRRLVLAGGDGTVHAAANLPGPPREFALIPTGRANNIAHSLGIPLDLHAAARLAVHGTSKPIDLMFLAARDTAALTVIVSSIPWIGKSPDGWSSYPRERAALSRFIARNGINRLLMLAGDAHMVAIDDGSNTDYSGTGRADFPIMHAAALDLRGSVKGGPYSEGTYPGSGQYGTVAVADREASQTVTLTGRRYNGDVLVTHRYTVPIRDLY